MTGKWIPLGPKNAIGLTGISESLVGGQSFSWTSQSKNQWIGVVNGSLVQLRWVSGQLEWRASPNSRISEKQMLHYLWLDESYLEAVDSLPWRSDGILNRAINQFLGLRILRQPLDETLLVFLLSSAKSIPQIKQLKERIYHLLGEEVGEGIYAFPGWSRLKKLTQLEARKLGTGYRAKYLVGTAEFLAENPNFFDNLRYIPYQEAKLRLMNLPGVGPKVADCVLLFGGEKPEAFPIDTWILQSLEKQYGMKAWNISQMEEFARIHFGKYAGLAQQFLFSYQRYFSKTKDTEWTKK